jgi:hypothetical protein
MTVTEDAHGQAAVLPAFEELPSVLEEARFVSWLNAIAAINEVCPTRAEEGGIDHNLKFVSRMLHGEVLPAPVILHLERQVSKIKSSRAHSA